MSGRSGRERFHESLSLGHGKGSFFWECIGYSGATLERWRGEGMELGVDVGGGLGQWSREVYEYFGLDWVNFAPVSSAIWPGFETEVIGQEGEYEIVRVPDGSVVKRRPDGSVAGHLAFPVADEGSYEKLVEHLDAGTPGRWGMRGESWDDWVSQARAGEWPTGLFLVGMFGQMQQLMGVENALVSLYQEPELMKRIVRDHCEFLIALAEQCSRDVDVDFCYLWEDMSYKGGMMLSPSMFEEFIEPAARRLIDRIKSLGIDIVLVDSDGDISELIPLYKQCGVTGFLPFEVRAGMDVRKVRQENPDIRIVGGIDKTLVAEGGKVLRDEVCGKVLPMLKDGGYVPCLDHQPHPEMPLECYREYVKLVRELLES